MLLVAAPTHLGDWTEEANEAWEWAIRAVSGDACSAFSPGSLIAATYYNQGMNPKTNCNFKFPTFKFPNSQLKFQRPIH